MGLIHEWSESKFSEKGIESPGQAEVIFKHFRTWTNSLRGSLVYWDPHQNGLELGLSHLLPTWPGDKCSISLMSTHLYTRSFMKAGQHSCHALGSSEVKVWIHVSQVRKLMCKEAVKGDTQLSLDLIPSPDSDHKSFLEERVMEDIILLQRRMGLSTWFGFSGITSAFSLCSQIYLGLWGFKGNLGKNIWVIYQPSTLLRLCSSGLRESNQEPCSPMKPINHSILPCPQPTEKSWSS